MNELDLDHSPTLFDYSMAFHFNFTIRAFIQESKLETI